MIPSAAQGAVAIASKKDNLDLNKILNSISCKKTFHCVQQERNFLKMKNTLDKEQRKLDAQNHSIKLLKEVPCGDQFPSCKFIAESHKNKQLLGDQRQLVKDLKFQLGEKL